jgi:hypothetical protein
VARSVLKKSDRFAGIIGVHVPSHGNESRA